MEKKKNRGCNQTELSIYSIFILLHGERDGILFQQCVFGFENERRKDKNAICMRFKKKRFGFHRGGGLLFGVFFLQMDARCIGKVAVLMILV